MAYPNFKKGLKMAFGPLGNKDPTCLMTKRRTTVTKRDYCKLKLYDTEHNILEPVLGRPS
jgi:hypothetical protein